MAADVVARAHVRKRRWEPWPLAIAGMLLAMAGVLAAFLWVSIARPDPVLVGDAYAASGRYDEALRAAARAAALGMRLELISTPAPGGVRVALRLLGADARPLAAERVRVQRERPNQGGLDASIEATPDADGWTAFVALPLAGRWIVEARAERGETLVVQRIELEAGR